MSVASTLNRNAAYTGQQRDFHTPEWLADATIYEVNLRNYTKEGTIQAFQSHLPRLEALGVKILWLMPVYPIGEQNRKGTLGSPYSIKDFRSVNPDLGTMQDLKELVKQAHDRGMKVILDWVANHTSWDSTLSVEHPEWFSKNTEGSFVSPNADWTDVIQLDYSQKGLWLYMTEAMSYWVQTCDIDGFRCDMAHLVPTEFWLYARKEVDAIKQLLWIAESEDSSLVETAFDLDYSWKLLHLLEDISVGKAAVNELTKYFTWVKAEYGVMDRKMFFTSNHDENAWQGSAISRFGPALPAVTALTFTLPGTPMLYGGQEAGLSQKLSFFEKDEIAWGQDPEAESLLHKLIELKKSEPALWSLSSENIFSIIETEDAESVFSFSRTNINDQLVIIVNLSDSVVETTMQIAPGPTLNLINNETVNLPKVRLAGWQFLVLKRTLNA